MTMCGKQEREAHKRHCRQRCQLHLCGGGMTVSATGGSVQHRWYHNCSCTTLANHIGLAIMMPHFSATCLVGCYLYLSCPDGYIHHFRGYDALASITKPHDTCCLCISKKTVLSHPNIILWTYVCNQNIWA